MNIHKIRGLWHVTISMHSVCQSKSRGGKETLPFDRRSCKEYGYRKGGEIGTIFAIDLEEIDV